MFRGVLSAIVTPLTADGGDLDLAALGAMIDRQAAGGVAGVVPCGSTGEFSVLTHDERRRVVEHCVAHAAGRLTVVPQTGALSTAGAVELSRHAAALGCAGVLAMPPFFAPLSPDDLKRYYAALVDAVDVPVIFYHNPYATGLDLSAGQIVDLCASVGIRHVKYTSSDVSGLTELLLDHHDAVQTLPAWDNLALTAFLSGATCSIWGAASAVPELCAELLSRAVDRELEATLETWRRAAPLFTSFGALGYVQAVRAAHTLLGHRVGAPRSPLAPLDATDEKRIARLLTAAGYDLAPDESRPSAYVGGRAAATPP